MNGKAILATAEKHIEKGVIVIAVGFALGMIWLYGINTPNTVPFNGAEYGPRDLNTAVLASAKELETAMSRADPGKVDPPQSRDQLLKSHGEGIFSALTPVKPDAKDAKGAKLTPVPRTLVAGGKEAVIPGLTEAEEATASIELVTPLPPEKPAPSFGRNMVVRKSVKLGDAPVRPSATPAAAEKAGEPMEVAWASIAGYWDSAAQRAEMTRKGYAAYRSKVYVAGVDAERQEVLPNGEWSEPKLVDGSQAMPDFKIPEPAIDDRGALINKAEIDEAFRVVRAEQNVLLQPPFYTTTAGKPWKLPPLEGHVEEDDDDAVSTGGKREKRQERPAPPRNTSVRGGTPPGGVRPPPGGSGDVFGGSGGGRVGGEGGGGGAAQRKEADDAKKQAKADLKDAREAMDKKEYSTAVSKAQAVVNNTHASNGDKDQAQGIVDKAQKKIADASGVPSATGIIGEGAPPGRIAPSTVMDDGGFGSNRGMTPMAASPSGGTAAALVTHPTRKLPAVFYHDDTVESGKTYRYRTRVNLWNRYVGRIKSLKNPEGARQAVLHGEWSLWSEPVTITPQTHFFVNSLKPGTDKISVEVWKWVKGKWIKRNVEAGVGDVIGGEFVLKSEERGEEAASDGEKKPTKKPDPTDFSTGAVVLDIRVEQPVKVRQNKGKGQFEYRDQKSLVLVYLDPADGQVKERVQAFDATDPLRKKLKEEAGDGT